MAIIITGKTTCRICSKVIAEEDLFYSFPAFVLNTLDPVYYYNDCGCHINCLGHDSVGLLALKMAKLFTFQISPINRICSITGEKITKQDEHFFVEMLTSNSKDILFKYNFIHLNKTQIRNWAERFVLIEAVMKLQKENGWRETDSSNPYLNQLLDLLYDR